LGKKIYFEKEVRPFLDHFKLIVLISIILFVLVKNSGCTAVFYDEESKRETDNIVQLVSSEEPLTIHPARVEINPKSGRTAILRVDGGEEPYVYFIKGDKKFKIQMIDSKSARLVYSGTETPDKCESCTVFILDNRGEMTSASITFQSETTAN